MATNDKIKTLIELHAPMIWRIALSHERDPSLAEDLYQDICLAIWASSARVLGAENPRAYVARIALNKSLAHAAARHEERIKSTHIENADTLQGETEGISERHLEKMRRREKDQREPEQGPSETGHKQEYKSEAEVNSQGAPEL